jgi:hypothetical protein
MPTDLDDILTAVAQLPASYGTYPANNSAPASAASVRDKLINLKPELRIAGIKGVRIRDIYTAGVYHYLTSLGIVINPETPKPRTENPRNPVPRELAC